MVEIMPFWLLKLINIHTYYILHVGACLMFMSALFQDDMNLSDDKKEPLRKMPLAQKKIMLEKFLQSKGPSGVSFVKL